MVINRASRDRNNWSRANRWFHRNVLETSATANKTIALLDQDKRATRPIIEFEANLKLFNSGTSAVVDIDVIDQFTKDAFSDIEGSFGYNVDGQPLSNGQYIIFTAIAAFNFIASNDDSLITGIADPTMEFVESETVKSLGLIQVPLFRVLVN